MAAASSALKNGGELIEPALRARVEAARDRVVAALRAERMPGAGWSGELSSSALSTATAIVALELVARHETDAASRLRERVRRGCAWLVAHQNADGGWGDTTRSFSNISTTALAWAALGLCVQDGAKECAAREAAERWLAREAGSVEPDTLVAAIERRYGRDRTFSIPILTLCALCGRLGPENEAWRRVRPLPFEVAVLPQRWFGALQLPVVSYALPALIAIGLVRHVKRPSRNPVARALRGLCRAQVLRVLERLQPPNGGFLEATPLTSFVTMSLAASGLTAHPVVRRGVGFIVSSERDDGSWAIDTNLATWVTTLAVQALQETGNRRPETGDSKPETGDRRPENRSQERESEARPAAVVANADEVRRWLLGQQHCIEHPYTLAAPGGWAWTDLPGGVPDADDTAGAVLALAQGSDGVEENAQRSTFNAQRSRGGERERAVGEAIKMGARWLVNLQNRDGGVPTFCRGWGKLPFDRSSPDITAHALRAWVAARPGMAGSEQERVDAAMQRAGDFLRRTQRADGAWVPLWFGHQENSKEENPLYGTARVLVALCEIDVAGVNGHDGAVDRAVSWLLAQQKSDGGWSGAESGKASVEETGLAVEALVAVWERRGTLGNMHRDQVRIALERGGVWLAAAVEREAWREPAPIGFYFAKLWYWERLYPLIFATGALNRLCAVVNPR